MLHNTKGKVLLRFSKHAYVCNCNEVEVLAILEALPLYPRNFHGGFIVESDSFNMMTWVSNLKANPWKFWVDSNEI